MGINLSNVYVYCNEILDLTKKGNAKQYLAHQILGKHRVGIFVFQKYRRLIAAIIRFLFSKMVWKHALVDD